MKSETQSSPSSQAADVLVIGGGGAGLAAAIEAAAHGARVILVEKGPALGGSTGWSVGSFTASKTKHQIRRGIADSPEAHGEDLVEMNARVRSESEPELRSFLVENSSATLTWLQDLGVEFVGPFEEPPHRVARMHNVIPGSNAYIQRLELHALKLGVEIQCNTSALSLLRHDESVCGANLSCEGRDISIKAGAVILTTGDLSANPNAFGQALKNIGPGLASVNRFATGDGHKIAMQVGAAISQDILAKPTIRFIPTRSSTVLSRLPTFPFLTKLMQFGFEFVPMFLIRPLLLRLLGSVLQPHPAIFENGAILINRDGKLFCDSPSQLATELTHQPEGLGYIIFDDKVTQHFSKWPHYLSTAPGLGYIYISDLCRYRPDVCRTADTMGELASEIGLEPKKLDEAIGVHNQKQKLHGCTQILDPPFVALGPVRSFLVLTDGGLKVDLQMRVKKTGGGVISGLFAAGAVGQGDLLLQGHGHHLAWAFTSGREAGSQAAAYALSKSDV